MSMDSRQGVGRSDRTRTCTPKRASEGARTASTASVIWALSPPKKSFRPAEVDGVSCDCSETASLRSNS